MEYRTRTSLVKYIQERHFCNLFYDAVCIYIYVRLKEFRISLYYSQFKSQERVIASPENKGKIVYKSINLQVNTSPD